MKKKIMQEAIIEIIKMRDKQLKLYLHKKAAYATKDKSFRDCNKRLEAFNYAITAMNYFLVKAAV